MGSYSRVRTVARYVKLLTLEINDTVFSTVSAASVTDGDSAVAVTTGLFVQREPSRLFSGATLDKAGVIGNRHIAPGGRCRLIIDDRHYGFTLLMMALREAAVLPIQLPLLFYPFYWAKQIDYIMPSKNSMGLLSSFRVTTAFFQEGV